MSEPILMALVQLFAIVAASVKQQVSENTRKILESYLRQHLNNSELNEYLKLFDELLFFHQPEDENYTLIDVNEQIATICVKINKGLHQRDKLLVFTKFIEFLDEGFKARLADNPEVVKLSDAYIHTIGNSFNLSGPEFTETLKFVTDPDYLRAHGKNLLIIGSEDQNPGLSCKFIIRERLNGSIMVLHIPTINTILCRYLGTDELFLNGHTVFPYRSFIFDKGYILKSRKINPVYYSDLISQFLFTQNKVHIEYSAKEIEFHFKNSPNGIQPFSFHAVSGELIGVMGGSGVGKSTLLNVLNGNIGLGKGEILINGLDIRKESEKLRGSIGFVPQDDLLIEELTVFQNLYFNARLCFNGFDDEKIKKAVSKTLADIDLHASKNLKVGDPLNKFISGGQRKRLNIALELIREPSILFADEPTSGLSSMDSEMVMLLLKEQTLKGKLVIVNIHQPSSDIFKLFDKLLIMDKGGYPIYYGNPIDALTYFKTISNFVNPEQSECLSCGYVNPEQILQITEAKTIDEYGKTTSHRKISPKEWYSHFRKNIQPGLLAKTEKLELPGCFFEVPGMFKQFRIFSLRNLLCKITNRQYMLINLLEAPFLAALLAFLTRYKFGDQYIFSDNRNLVPYLFMSVVVSLFLGMMVSAEELIKDRRILKREAFLHLSRFSYINSKIILLFALSALQSFLYVVAGNLILGIHGMTLSYWLILFATSCFANIVGLNISAGLNSVVAIYILIPFILVPQLLLSGTIVPFDYLNPAIASRENVPMVGNLMTSRWTFEALAVEQFSNNEYEKIFYPYDKEISHYSYITAYVVPTLKSELDESQRNLFKHTEPKKTSNYLEILKHEIPELQKNAGFAPFPYLDALNENLLNDSIVQYTKLYLDSLSRFYSSRLSAVSARRDNAYEKLRAQLGDDGVFQFKQAYHNENLASLITNKDVENKIIAGDGKLIRKKDHIFMEPESNIGKAHFYAPVKIIGSWKIDTFWFNFFVIWLMSFVLYLTLLHDTLRKVIGFFEMRSLTGLKKIKMKNISLSLWLFLFLMIGCTIGAKAQSFLAGQHATGNYFVDIVPDITINGPNNHELPWLPAARFDIDINGDGLNDFEFYSYGSWANGAGSSELIIKIRDTATSQVALGYMDTCNIPNSTYFLNKMAKSLKKNEPINNDLTWLNTNLFLTYTFWAVISVNCESNGFANDSLGNYIAVRMLRPNDTLYGWIKLTNVNFLKFTLQEFACTKNCTGIDEYKDFARIYPVPTTGTLTIETQLPGADLVVYNQYGMEIMKKKLVSKKTPIDLGQEADGIYFFKLFSGGSFIVRKIIKDSGIKR